MKKSLTLALIIPAYNEENHIGDCLRSIERQTVAPDEVIVVNNNSTDRTVEIARGFPFVKIVHEKKQGLIPARNRGLDIARSDLLGRLDADSVLNPDWVEVVKHAFTDRKIDAASGPARVFVDSHLPFWYTTLWTEVYFMYALAVFRFRILWGPNMVLRRSSWLEVKSRLCKDDKLVHEDQDLSVVLKSYGKNIVFIHNLQITTDGRRLLYVPKALEYNHRRRLTLERHQKFGTLDQARKYGSISPIGARLLEFALMPFGLLYGLMAGLYSIEKKLGLRR
jgi:glycosyltransferase involved in cell wall biosynthesis